MSAPRYAVLGSPAAKSLSPKLFGWLFARMGVDATYEAVETAPEALADRIAEMRRGLWAGFSVTIPHKLAVRDMIDEEDPLAARIGAVNTLAVKQGRICGYNTDAYGCRRALEDAGANLAGARVVVLGAGGAARGGVFSMLDAGAASVLIANRTQARAEALAESTGARACQAVALEQLQTALNGADILIQSSSGGMGDAGASPLPAGTALPPALIVQDMVYRPLETALLRQARASGCRTVDGLWMLVHQALQQFRLWTGLEPPAATAVALHDYLQGEAT